MEATRPREDLHLYEGRDNLQAMRAAVNYNSYLAELIVTFAASPLNPTVIDFGAGLGDFARAVKYAGAQVICVEPDDDMRALINAQLPDHEVATFGQDQAGKAADALKSGGIAILDTGTDTKHAVNIIANEGGMVTYQDPYGARVTEPRADFEKSLVGAVLPKSAGVQSTGANWDVGGDTTMATTTTTTTTTTPPTRRR